MAKIYFSVGSFHTYRVQGLELPGRVHQLEADLQPGRNVFTSDRFELGTIISLGSRPLVGQLSFGYTLDPENETITVCGTDYESSDGMKLITMPQGMEAHSCIEHASNAGFTRNAVNSRSLWDYRSQLTPGAAEIFQQIVQDANDDLIRALQGSPNLLVRVRRPLPRISPQLYQDLCVVRRNGKVLGTFDPTKEYAPGDIIHIPESRFQGTVTWPDKANFANVDDSSYDPYPKKYTSWIKLWDDKTKVSATTCTSEGYGAGQPFVCSPPGTAPFGGHVVKGQVAMSMPAGSDDVYIMPICPKHNNRKNDKYYMACITNREAVWLSDYDEPDPGSNGVERVAV